MQGEDQASLPDDLHTWVEAHADEEGVDSETVLARALGTYRLAVSDAGESLGGDATVPERLDGVEGRVEAFEGKLDEKISNVRTRVVRVKRETGEKAPRDHTHPELDTELDRLASDVHATQNRTADLDERVDAGFGDFEEILTYPDEMATTVDENPRTVARTLLDLRARAADLEAAGCERTALLELLRTTNVTGEKKVRCEGRGETVRLDLLSEPRYPSCWTPFHDLSSSPGFFGSATLHTGRPPALESTDSTRVTDAVEDLLGEIPTGVVDDATDSDDDRYASWEGESAQQGIAAGSEHGNDWRFTRMMTDDNSTDDAVEGEPPVSGDCDDSFGCADPGNDSAEAVRAPDGSHGERSDDADSAPLSDLAGHVAERRARSRVIGQRDEVGGLLESVETGELDRDNVWTSLVEGGDDMEVEGVGVGVEAVLVDDGEGVMNHVIPKSEFCQRCEHSAAPPEFACHHEEVTTVGFEDSDYFRVRNRPMVKEDD